MTWTKETVERALFNADSCSRFIENKGRLKVDVCGVSLLFFANCDNTVSAYYEYLPSCNDDMVCAREFCRHAIPYLKDILVRHSDKILCSEHCIKPIIIDLRQ